MHNFLFLNYQREAEKDSSFMHLPSSDILEQRQVKVREKLNDRAIYTTKISRGLHKPRFK